MYRWLKIDGSEDFAKLRDIGEGQSADFSSAYSLDAVANRLADGLDSAVRHLLVELAYVDKDYRSTYYHFYAKKGRNYRQDCLRVHLFGENVTFEEATLSLSNDAGCISDHYYGFVTLRPTFHATIGRSIIAPKARKGASGKVICSRHKVHLLGYNLEVHGFPWMQQHSDISVCAHAACWAILRHYSERYRKYRELLTQDVTRLAYSYDPGGMMPSKGLRLAHAERVFAEAGNYPVVNFIGDDDSRTPFFRQMFAYIESGFPLFLGIGGDHAVAAIGYRWKAGRQQRDVGIRNAWDMVESLIVADDNHLPYLMLSHEKGRDGDNAFLQGSGDRKRHYTLSDVNAFIAPLPEKIYYPADAVETFAGALPERIGMIAFPQVGDLIIRYFVTTAAALRRHMREHQTEFPSELVNAFMIMPMAQFVWIVEYATHEEWDAKRVSVRAVIDATASAKDNDVLWAVYGKGIGLFFDRSEGEKARRLKWEPDEDATFGRMEENLSTVGSV